jgi:hypothetical protein
MLLRKVGKYQQTTQSEAIKIECNRHCPEEPRSHAHDFEYHQRNYFCTSLHGRNFFRVNSGF